MLWSSLTDTTTCSTLTFTLREMPTTALRRVRPSEGRPKSLKAREIARGPLHDSRVPAGRCRLFFGALGVGPSSKFFRSLFELDGYYERWWASQPTLFAARTVCAHGRTPVARRAIPRRRPGPIGTTTSNRFRIHLFASSPAPHRARNQFRTVDEGRQDRHSAQGGDSSESCQENRRDRRIRP